MKILENTIYYLEELKIPINSSLSPEDWKDWYHYVLFDTANDIRILFNVCFSGRRKLGDITVTLQITLPDKINPKKYSNYGFIKTYAWEDVPKQKMPVKLDLKDFLELEITQNKVYLMVQSPDKDFCLNFKGTPKATPILIPELFPYGSGFIGWGLIPGLTISGEVYMNKQKYPITPSWYCYHDHNFGRFRWGDETIGWIWWVATLSTICGQKVTVVFHRGNDKKFEKLGTPFLFIYLNDELVKSFVGETITINFIWGEKPERLPILPGSMASVFSQRKVLVPISIALNAKDELDEFRITKNVDAKMEIILPDYQEKQYTFLKEFSGKAEAFLSINGEKLICKTGLFYAEYVH